MQLTLTQAIKKAVALEASADDSKLFAEHAAVMRETTQERQSIPAVRTQRAPQ